MIAALKNGDPNDFLRSLDRYTNIIPYDPILSHTQWLINSLAQKPCSMAPFWAILVNLSQEII